MEERGAAKPGLLVLTTGLSKAFRRLDKYSAMLQELERHMESGHPDRGNTQRSVAVYKDIAVSVTWNMSPFQFCFNNFFLSNAVSMFSNTTTERVRTSSAYGTGKRLAGTGVEHFGRHNSYG